MYFFGWGVLKTVVPQNENGWFTRGPGPHLAHVALPHSRGLPSR